VIVAEFQGLRLIDALVIVIYDKKQEEITGVQKRGVGEWRNHSWAFSSQKVWH
jgi:hypothetical protein